LADRNRSEFGYNGYLGRWWRKRSSDIPHAHAYRNIARFVHSSLSTPPGKIVDYACGAGDLLARLAWRFPNSRLIGLDGSRVLLAFAARKIARMGRKYQDRVTLIETMLPNSSVGARDADVAVFAFPNMVPFSLEDDPALREKMLEAHDLRAAQSLAYAQDDSDTEGTDDPEATRFSLVQGRLVSQDLRGLLRKGGLCVRVEYGKARRDELGPVDLLRVSYEEGSIEHEIEGHPVKQWFRVVASSYIRSRVMEDVYQQTRDRRDLGGGYLITVLRAI
jgi:SAM-dependent methyltransferase